MIFLVTCIGAIALFYIQFKLYKAKQNQGIKQFIKSKELLEILRESLLVILSVTLALNLTGYIETKQTQEKVIKILDGISLEIEREASLSRGLKYDYETGHIDMEQLALSLSHNTAFSENMLTKDIVIAVMSPSMHSTISNNIHDINRVHEAIIAGQISDTRILTALEILEGICERTQEAIDKEKLYLQGKLSEEELKKY